ncbi:MAG: SAM-dependent methyltransferase, partial [Gammaproteobacteria bacterium]|nr:SAM-dependent methyltransferase [Gammaproteobacteria bacterium]
MAQQHSEKLINHLRQRIADAGGWISFADYMQQILYAPGLGYYSAGAHKLGAAGDFITAPEVSPLFGSCVAAQCADILRQSGGNTIVELGAGTGALAQAVIREFPPAKYRIVEVSADLRQRQATCLADIASSEVSWAEGPDDLPTFNGVLVANEVIDALPVERFRMVSGEVHALGVALDNERFVSETRIAGQPLIDAVRKIEDQLDRRLPDGYESEIRPQLADFIGRWAAKITRGAMIWIDYGCSRAEYYAAERGCGTLMCHYRHRAHSDPFVYPGLQDITAWVDFTALAEAGLASGMRMSGYTTQAHFLLGCGIDQLYDTMRRATDDAAEHIALNEQLRRLMM